MLSFLIILAGCFLITSQATLPARFGLVQLQMGAASQGTFQINFRTILPSSNYSQMVAVSYVNNFDTANGIIITSSCPNQTETGMGCKVYSENPNKNNIVYVSYIASCIQTWMVGTYYQQYTFDGNTTEMSKTVSIKPNISSSLFSQIDTNYFHSDIVIAGISSVDPDFDIVIIGQQPIVNTLNLQISFPISIKEFHNKTVGVTYGYFLYDVYQYNLFSKNIVPFSPSNIPQGEIYVINRISSKKTLGISSASSTSLPLQSMFRKLQVMPVTSGQLISSDPSNIAPINTKNVPAPMKMSSSLSSKASPARVAIAPSVQPQPSLASQLLRSGNLSSLKITFVNYDPSIINGLRASDGIIQTFQNILPPPRAKSTSSITGINNQLFNTLFATNGLTLLSETDLSQTYYTEIIAVTDIPQIAGSAPAGKSIYYPIVVENKPDNLTCSSGVKVFTYQNIDLIQRKLVPFCLSCSMGRYADIKRKICVDFPVMRSYLNQYDTIN